MLDASRPNTALTITNTTPLTSYILICILILAIYFLDRLLATTPPPHGFFLTNKSHTQKQKRAVQCAIPIPTWLIVFLFVCPAV
jgi:hypothetical protein